MKFKAEITIMPNPDLPNPQGEAITSDIKNINLSQIENARIGRHISLDLQAPDIAAAERIINEACNKILVNPETETSHFILLISE